MSKNTNLRKITNYLTADNNTLSSNVSQTITGSLTVTGNLTAQQFILSSSVTYLTESFASGSHKFGDSSDDIHTFTGSLVVSGSANPLRVGSNLLFVSSSGNVGIGTISPAYSFELKKTGLDSTVWGYNIAQLADSTTNTNGLRIGTSTSVSGLTNLVAATNNDPSQFGFWTYNGSTWGERMRIHSTGGLLVGTTTSPTITGGNIIVLGDTIFCNGTFNVGNPYNQSLRIDIVWNNWGGNNVAAIVEVDIVAREWGNLGGIAFGKVYALSSAGAATFNNTLNTTNITSANGSFSLSSPANYTLRLNFTPTNSKDVMGYLIKIPASTAGTGTSVASITASLV
jgi:hypothetical protein